MALTTMRPCGDYRTSYKADQTIFQTRLTLIFIVLAIAFPDKRLVHQ